MTTSTAETDTPVVELPPAQATSPEATAPAGASHRPSVAVVTCAYGPRDRQPAAPAGADAAVVVTDAPHRGGDGWTALVHPRHHVSTVLGTKLVKASAHRYTDCDVVVWQDGHTAASAQFVEAARDLPVGVVVGLAHPHFGDLVAHASWARTYACQQYVGSDLAKQAAAYRSALPGGADGTWQPPHLWPGLLAARRETWEAFSDAWTAELTTWSAMDALSLPYVLWRAGVTVEALPLSAAYVDTVPAMLDSEVESEQARAHAEWGLALYQRDYNRATDIGATIPSDIYLHMDRIRELVIAQDAKTVVELGIRFGMSAVAWLAGVEATGGHLWAVDLDEAPEHVSAPEWCTVHRGFSTAPEIVTAIVDAAREEHGAEAGLDLVFIDTNHDVDLTHDELETWAPHVRVGGIIAMHDGGVPYFPHHDEQDWLGPQPPFPVRVAIERFLTGPEAVLETTSGAEVRRWRLRSHTDECNGFTILERMC